MTKQKSAIKESAARLGGLASLRRDISRTRRKALAQLGPEARELLRAPRGNGFEINHKVQAPTGKSFLEFSVPRDEGELLFLAAQFLRTKRTSFEFLLLKKKSGECRLVLPGTPNDPASFSD